MNDLGGNSTTTQTASRVGCLTETKNEQSYQVASLWSHLWEASVLALPDHLREECSSAGNELRVEC